MVKLELAQRDVVLLMLDYL